jgi:hypothetical protein
MRFKSKLSGGWTFASIQDEYAPPVTEGWGRTPVRARVDDHEWETSVWRDTKHGTLLAVPKSVRGEKGHGDEVAVEILPPGPRRIGERPTKPRRRK